MSRNGNKHCYPTNTKVIRSGIHKDIGKLNVDDYNKGIIADNQFFLHNWQDPCRV